ncbi:uncharacterized protein [Chelonus insularis]|uniref:uncharacterized protein n=1 Tax=Chelonus insularis TaxID=460826 RepID=UPI00158AEEAD|nr:uncharacterized protein LOC118064306 [Chelonus insularis]
MSDRTLIIYTSYKRIVEKTLVASALWPSKSSQFSFRCILFIHLSLCFCPLFGMYNFCKKYIKNIILLTKGLGIIISFVTVIFKVPPKSLTYWITYAVQSLANVPCICWTVSVDTAYTLYIFQMTGLLRGISYYLKNLKNEKDYEATLSQCIDLYVILMKCRDKIQKIFGPIILWTILSNGVVMCSMVFQITHSENCIDVLSSIDWIGNKKLASVLLIMLPQQSLKLTACNFSIVSVDMFLKVMNTTISYFFLLQTMDEK